MKYIVIVGDGMADYPLKKLGGKTPLEVADKPNMDSIASKGKMGILKTVPDGMVPGSDVANLSILGYDPRKYYTGRGPLEAGSMGVKLGDEDTAFRCNLITEKDGRVFDYSSGHISTEEARELIEEMKTFKLGEFYIGVSYRHLFVMRNCNPKIQTSPPHDIGGKLISDHLIKPRDSEIAQKLNQFIMASKGVLSKHPVNIARVKQGKNPANMIWLWSNGKKPKLEKMKDKYGLRAALISAVPLINGIGIYTGMEIINVPGVTGYYDTNYEGKADYALKALESNDFVYVHVEAPDEAGHEGNLETKIKTIEDLDKRLVGRILDGAGECKIAILPDHPTPIKVRMHVPDPIPFAIYAPHLSGDKLRFDESSAKMGSLGFIVGEEFMRLLLTI
ncbi:2,3-bisphosphoglycerate-independent phosphoglycerate mutase [subsurface metagenome]|nr:cofactor-independent phosphoglycerate mutase [Hadesarchaea archaeon]